jgi:hypothetical protein
VRIRDVVADWGNRRRGDSQEEFGSESDWREATFRDVESEGRGGKRRRKAVNVHMLASIHSAAAAAEVVVTAAERGRQWKCLLNTSGLP